jgi:hypothetical protein
MCHASCYAMLAMLCDAMRCYAVPCYAMLGDPEVYRIHCDDDGNYDGTQHSMA